MTTEQLDRINDIMFNTPMEEIEQAISALNAEELLALETECIDLANKQMEIAGKVMAHRQQSRDS